MGAEESVPIPPPPPSAYPDQRYSPYFMFSLYYDTLHLVYAPPEIANLIVKTATLALGANSIQYHKPKLEHGYKIVFHETLFRLVNRFGFAVGFELGWILLCGLSYMTSTKTSR